MQYREIIFWLVIFWLPYIIIILAPNNYEKRTTKQTIFCLGIYFLTFIVVIIFFCRRIDNLSIIKIILFLFIGGLAVCLSVIKILFNKP